ncbi:MAG: tripartite tricarboxylate transporter substrate binding protein [Betaproteobacteria bacterium]
MRRHALTLGALLWLATALAPAADLGRIQLVNPFPAGGPPDISGSTPADKVLRTMQDHAVPPVTDVLARILQQSLAFSLGTTVSLVRRSRHNGLDAQRHAARITAHGRTLLIGSTGTIVLQPLVGRADALQDLRPVALVAHMPFVLVSRAQSGIDRVPALIERAHAAPGRLHLGSPGDFTIGHLAGALFTRAAGIVLQPVPFNGSAAAARAVMVGHTEVALLPLPAVLPYAANPRLRPLAITSRQRHAALAAVPTVAETGIAGAAYSAWYGLFVAAATPQSIIDRIDAAIAVELRAEGVGLMMSRYGLSAEHLAADGLRETIREEYRRWRPYIEEMRVR